MSITALANASHRFSVGTGQSRQGFKRVLAATKGAARDPVRGLVTVHPAWKPTFMPTLINRCINDGRRVLCYEVKDYWKAIDKIEDLDEVTRKTQADKGFLKKILMKKRG